MSENEFLFDGSTLYFHYHPLVIKNNRFIPFQTLASLLSEEITTDAITRKYSLKKATIDLEVKIGNRFALLNGQSIELSALPLKINNTTYIPLDIAMKATSGIIQWDVEENKASVAFERPMDEMVQTIANGDELQDFITVASSYSYYAGTLSLINKWNPIDKAYIPDHLVSLVDKNKKFIVPSKVQGIQVKSETLGNLSLMFKSASIANCKDLIVSNGYRSFNTQTYFYNKKVALYSKSLNSKDAQDQACKVVAPPGMSEHQTGLAVDMTTRSLLQTKNPLSEAFSKTREGKWLSENSWKYGFVIRYQPEKTKYTGIMSEPWHLRYVGLPHAEIMHKNKYCLEEYLETIKKTKYIKFQATSGKTYEIFYLDLPPTVGNLKLAASKNVIYDISRYGKYGFIITKAVG